MNIRDTIMCFLGFHCKKLSVEKYPDKTHAIIMKCVKCGLEEHIHSGNGFEGPTMCIIKNGKLI